MKFNIAEWTFSMKWWVSPLNFSVHTYLRRMHVGKEEIMEMYLEAKHEMLQIS